MTSWQIAGHKVDAANIIAGGQVMARVDFTGVDSPYPYALMLPQSDTERLLEEHLIRLGVKPERQTEVLSFRQDGRGVTAMLRKADGLEEAVEADWLIGCDGAHSAVRHGLGLSFLGDTLQSDWILADIHLGGYPLPIKEMATYWHEDGVLIVFSMSATRFRLSADIGLSKGSAPQVPRSIKCRRSLIAAAREAWWLPIRSGSRDFGSTNVKSAIIAPGAFSWPAMPLMSTARPADRA